MFKDPQVHNACLAAHFSVVSALQTPCSLMKEHYLAITFVLTLTTIVPSLHHSFLLELHCFSSVSRMKFVQKLLQSITKMSPCVLILSLFTSALKTVSANRYESYSHFAKTTLHVDHPLKLQWVPDVL